MHEAALSQGLMKILLDEAGRRGVRSISRVWLKVGKLKAVEPRSLQACFGMFAEGTIAEGAELIVEHVPVQVRCKVCLDEFQVEGFRLRCVRCGAAEVEILRGEELYIESFDA
ncbi:putative hydrogenase nickel incorporation protein HypA [Stutzerimonas stutzeri]|uniref:hydrogenase maturation nickel metallochaperone HypA n=1 Tax=Stutzerimonas stutzeri TaxID=316 RepID=UPI0024A05961|nr:hydrogenase maturation nickel metallochaperone HypA [Stutzerimonas stutzeri]GLZ24117.1 putative hydrogenase nickel incorporation protein HypA [Stutzerimonas stutzeri]